jgi:hypothetical protein
VSFESEVRKRAYRKMARTSDSGHQALIFARGPFIPTFAKVSAAIGGECWDRTTRRPIAGLRSPGKGANRTILDCLLGRMGRNCGLLPPRGVAGAGSLTWVTFLGVSGRFHRLRALERVWNRDDSVFGGSSDSP